jgi:SAM-dependent methyltransferase
MLDRMKQPCRVCGNTENNTALLCREKMFGLGDEFLYFQCGDCRCLQIAAVPEGMARYYPLNYYSYTLPSVEQHGLKARLAGLRDYVQLTRTAWLGLWFPKWAFAGGGIEGLGPLPLKRKMWVLDVGCGRGRLLSILHRAGFRHLSGIDPFLPADVVVAPGVTVRKQSLEAMGEQFDLIMFHHVLEHIADGRKTLERAKGLLRPGGKILVRIPTVDSAAWESYQANWVSLDAPRHFYLHSRSSLALLAGQAGLAVEQWWCDAGGFQFWASELYKSGVSLVDQAGQRVAPEDYFTTAQLRQFELEAQSLNRQSRGDQIAAILIREDG